MLVTVPARPDERHRVGHARDRALDVGDVIADHGHRVRQLLRRGGIGVQELLGDAHATDVHRDETVGRVGAEHELGGATTDVDDEIRRGRVEVGGRTEERQRGLFLTREQLGLDARVARGGEELVAIRRVARRAGGGGAHGA